MTREKIRSLLILLLCIASIPALYYLERKFFSTESLFYSDQGISFSIRNYTRAVTGIYVFPPREEVPPAEPEGEKVIIPGQGLGEIRLGDSLELVDEKWPRDWKKYGYRDQTTYYSPELNVSLGFDNGNLRSIYTWNAEYRTREGIAVGDVKEKVLQAYGEPPQFSGRWMVRISILGSIAWRISRFLIAAGVLALLNVFLVGKGVRRRGRILIPAAFIAFLLIYNIPSFIKMGLGYFSVYEDLEMLVQTLIIAALPAAIFAGIFLGESFARRKGWPGWKKQAVPVFAGALLLAAVIIVWRAYQALLGIWPFSLWFWPQLSAVIFIPLLYLFWYQFNVLFARAPRAPVSRNPERELITASPNQ